MSGSLGFNAHFANIVAAFLPLPVKICLMWLKEVWVLQQVKF